MKGSGSSTDLPENDSSMIVDDGQILARRIFAISRLTPVMMLANIANAVSVILVLWLEDQVRLDALVWALTDLMLGPNAGEPRLRQL